MAYVDVPLAPQRIKDSQPIIRQNFIEINALIDVDHYTFGSPTIGEHKKVTLPDQGLPPVFPGNDLGIYAQVPTAVPQTGVNELYIRKRNNVRVPITAALLNGDGWAYLPSGLLIKWGTSNVNGFNQPVVFPDDGNIAIPRFGVGSVFQVFLSSSPAVITPTFICTLVSGSVNNLGFNANSFTSNTGLAANGFIDYLAIGI